MPKSAKSKGFIVTTSSDRPIKDIAKDLARAGFTVGQILEEVGSITGTGDPKLIRKLRGISGVADVSPETAIDIGRPNSSETW